MISNGIFIVITVIIVIMLMYYFNLFGNKQIKQINQPNKQIESMIDISKFDKTIKIKNEVADLQEKVKEIDIIKPIIEESEINSAKYSCRSPTITNPMMNIQMTDFNMPDPPVACNADDDEIKNDIKVNYNYDLFRSVEDLWGDKNSERQFYTTPNTAIPNNQTEFALWLYGNTDTCKNNQQLCADYYDPLWVYPLNK